MPSTRRVLHDANTDDNSEECAEPVLKALGGDNPLHLTPTRVLRSGRRVAATPQVPASARRKASRVPAEEQTEAIDLQPRRVPVTEQENESKTEPGEAPTTQHRARRLQQLPDTGKAAQRSSRKPAGRRKLENSPISGLIEHAGMIRLNAKVPEENVPPPGLLTEVRKAQQDVRIEQMLSNLRAEIMEVQEDVRRESASDVSSGHSPTELSSTSTNRYQDTPSSRRPRGGPFHSQFEELVLSPGGAEDGSAPGLRPPQNTPAVHTLVPLTDVLRTGSSCGESGSEAGDTARPTEAGSTVVSGASVAADICAKLAALRGAKNELELSGGESSSWLPSPVARGVSLTAGLQVPELDTDGSDTAEKLEALRTQSVMEDAEAPEVVDLQEIEAIEEVDEEALGSEDPVAPEGFVPRPAAGPSHMDRKLRRLQEREWGSPHELKVQRHALQRAKEEAAEARQAADDLGSAEKAVTRKLVQHAISNAVQSDGRSLGEVLLRHKSRLERLKDAAAASRAYERASRPARAAQPPEQGLAQVLTKHKSRLQLEKEAAADAAAAAKPAPARESQLPSYMRPTAAFRHATSDTSSLGENLVVHRSRLERDRDAAKEAAKLGSPRQVAAPKPVGASSGWGVFGESRVHKSRLEQEKEEAAQRGGGAQAPVRRVSRLASVWSGGGLGDLKVHKSKLEVEKEAWSKAAARQSSAHGDRATPRGTPRPSSDTSTQASSRFAKAVPQPNDRHLLFETKPDAASAGGPQYMGATASSARKSSTISRDSESYEGIL